jgi:hypothetical protein
MREMIFILIMAVAASVLLVAVLVHFDKPRVESIRKMLPNCEYLGTPKDVSSVAIFDCNGVIEIRRKK